MSLKDEKTYDENMTWYCVMYKTGGISYEEYDMKNEEYKRSVVDICYLEYSDLFDDEFNLRSHVGSIMIGDLGVEGCPPGVNPFAYMQIKRETLNSMSEMLNMTI